MLVDLATPVDTGSNSKCGSYHSSYSDTNAGEEKVYLFAAQPNKLMLF